MSVAADTPEDPQRWLRDWLNAFAQEPRNQREGYHRAWADLRAEENIIKHRGKPLVLRCDSGPEFVSQALTDFCAEVIDISYIAPGEPWNNGYIESFNNRLRDECLNLNRQPNRGQSRFKIWSGSRRR